MRTHPGLPARPGQRGADPALPPDASRSPRRRAGKPGLTGATAAKSRPVRSDQMIAIAALVAWVLTASIGVYMLRTWVARGGLRRQRATGVGVPPAVVFGHARAAIALGVCTVTLWTPYPVIVPPVVGGPGGWVPPEGEAGGSGPAGSGVSPGGGVPPRQDTDAFKVTDEMIASMLADPFPVRRQPRPRPRLLTLIPVVHGFGALTTFMLTVLAAIGSRLGAFCCQ